MTIQGVSFDKVGNVLIRYKADTTQIQGELEKLKSSVDIATVAPMEWAKSWTESINHTVEQFGKINAALEGVHKIVEIGKEGFHEYAEQLRMNIAAAGADMEKLTEAAHGLRTEDELRAFAAKALHGVQALTNEQLQETQQAMVALTRRGFDQQDVTEKLTNAVVGLKTKGLDKLGIALDETASDGDKFHEIMAKIHALAIEGASSSETEAEKISQIGVNFANSADTIKESIGQIVVAMGPLIELAAKVAGLAADVSNKVAEGWSDLVAATRAGFGNSDQGAKLNAKYGMARDSTSGEMMNIDVWDTAVASGYKGTKEEFTRDRAANMLAARQRAAKEAKDKDALDKILATSGGSAFDRDPWAAGPDVVGIFENILGNGAAKFKKNIEEAKAAAIKKAQELAKLKATLANEQAKTSTDALLEQLQMERLDEFGVGAQFFGRGSNTQFLGQSAGGYSLGQQQNALASSYAKGGTVDQNMDYAYNQFRERSKGKFLEGTFGKIDEFEAYKKAFDGLSGAVDSAFKAWINGSESLGEAFKKAISGALTAIASQMLIESLKHAAYALGSIAFGDVAGASAHAQAAAAFAAGAIVAGVAAREMGGGGHSTQGAGSGAAKTYSGGNASSNGSNGPVIVYGDSFSDDSPYMRQLKAKKLVGKALGTSGTDFS